MKLVLIKSKLYKIRAYFISLNIIWKLWVFIAKKFSAKFKYYQNNPFKIPIVINNFNRLSTLKLMVAKLNNLGYKNIFVIDNDSKYPPLLKYYDEAKEFKLIKSENLGHRSVFISNNKLLRRIRKSCFIYTDSDLILNENLPNNFVEEMFSTLLENNEVLKVGFSIEIDNVNIENTLNEEKVKWERKYWKKPIGNDKYVASIDTTFALYRPILYKAKNSIVRFYRGIRIAGSFTCQHEPWYWDLNNLNEEQKYYIENADSSSTYVNTIKEKQNE